MQTPAISGFWIGFGACVHALLFGVLTDALGYPSRPEDGSSGGGSVLEMVVAAEAIAAEAEAEATSSSVALTLLGVAGMHAVVMGVAWWCGFCKLSFYGAELSGPSGASTHPAGPEGKGQEVAAGVDAGPATGAIALLRTTSMVGVLVVHGAFMFCGMAMKQLLSTIFEQTLGMTHLQSTYYSAACLVCYWACRALSPLFSSGDRVFKVTCSAVPLDYHLLLRL